MSVDIEDIEFLGQLRFSYTEIAKILEISRSTLYRRLEEEGISRYSKYSDITDNDLDTEITEIKLDHPNDGERLLIGHLAARGIIVPRAKVRASIHRVDPESTQLRRSITIRRRIYHVEGPNAVWHVDGHHKLIRWRMVTHGSIDGYSRTVVFLKCSNNNRASTVLAAFTAAVEIHGLPERIRTDLGGENVGIWRYMVEQHNTERAVITGSSTHNERIERLWRDVFRCVGVLFHDCFRELEDSNCLDPLNETDIFCLHYIFIPRINWTLEKFIESWNNHSLSSENNFTPNQLFIRGAIQQSITPYHPSNNSDVEGSPALPTPSNHVPVPQNGFLPCPSLYREINRIDPLDSSYNFGRDLYLRLQNVVGLHLVNGCNDCVS